MYFNTGLGGISRASSGIGVVGIATNTDTTSITAQNNSKRGVMGIALDTIGAIGVVGYGYSTNSVGIYTYAAGTGSKPGVFSGDVQVTGIFSSGNKFFMIDHPLDPANQYLYHGCVESSELKNFYDGIVTLDVQGEAEISLPSWFETLNSDLRYQLICLGQSSPVYISQGVKAGRFKIAGGSGWAANLLADNRVRQDAYAQKTPQK